MAIIATPYEVAVVPGPFTKRGLASSVFTLLLEFSLGFIWIPAAHFCLFLLDGYHRNRHWRCFMMQQYDGLMDRLDDELITPIEDATIHGWESKKNRFWYRLPGRKMDEFMEIESENQALVDQFIAFIGLAQAAKKHERSHTSS